MTGIDNISTVWRRLTCLSALLTLGAICFTTSCASSTASIPEPVPAQLATRQPPASTPETDPPVDVTGTEATPVTPAIATSVPPELLGGSCEYTHPNDPLDDPNPPYDQTAGRYPVSPNPIPAGYPTPRTTGFCGAGLVVSDLAPTEGMTVTQDGAVLENLDVLGGVLVRANDVTIRNSQITSAGRYALQLADGYSNLVVEYTRIRGIGPDVSSAVYAQGFITLTAVHISGGNDQMKASSGALVEHSYFTGAFVSPGTHNDVVQVRTGDNYTFRGNSMFGPWQQPTSVFLFQAKAGAGGGPIRNVLIEDNYLSGGGYTITTMAPDFTFTDGVVRNNRIELDSWRFGWSHDTADVNYSNNVVMPS